MTEPAPSRPSPGPSSWWSALPPLAVAGLFVAGFFGFVRLNGLAAPGLREYGSDWFDHVPGREAQLMLALVFLAGPAAIALTLALARAAGVQLVGLATRAATRPRLVVAGAVAFAILASLLVATFATQHAPLTDDEQIYRFQVGLLRDGLLAGPQPPSQPPFMSQFIVFKGGNWTGVYPWGHVALLLPGAVLGYIHLWPHLAAGLAVLLTYLLARELWPDDRRAPLIAALFVATSPFLAFTAATLHNVTSSLVAVTAGAFFLTRALRRRSFLWAALAGLAFGFELHARIFNGVAIGAACGAVALGAAVQQRLGWRTIARLAAGVVVGILPFLVLYLYINWRLTGDALQQLATVDLARRDRHMFGFWPRKQTAYNFAHTPVLAFGKTGTNFLRLALWSAGSALSLAGVGALLCGLRRRASDLVVLAPVVALLAAYYFFFTSPVYDTGPVYYLDALPFLALASARAASTLADRGDGARRHLAAGHLALVLTAAMTFWSLMGIAAHHVSDSILGPYRAVERAHIRHAIVWWNPPPNFKSWVMTRRLPHYTLRDDVIFAKDSNGKAPILAAFPDRATYAIRYPDGVHPVVMKWSPGTDPDLSPIVEPLPESR